MSTVLFSVMLVLSKFGNAVYVLAYFATLAVLSKPRRRVKPPRFMV